MAFALAFAIAAATGGWMLFVARANPGHPPGPAASDAAARHVEAGSGGAGGIASGEAGRDDRRVDARGGAGVPAALAYDPDRPLSVQWEAFRQRADRGEPYATCVLALTLDACVAHADRGDDNPLDLESPDVLARGNERQIDAVSRELADYDDTEKMCAGLGQSALLERDARLHRSARMGDPAAMARFALDPVSAGTVNLKDLDRVLEYRKTAVSMLDRAAAAGVPEALRGAYRAYSAGVLESAIGDVELRRDPVRAEAAGSVLLLFAEDGERTLIEKNVAALRAGMDDDALARADALAAAYRRAYQAYARRTSNGADPAATGTTAA
ncbi:MAG: hypothetical protein ACTHOH_06900 [Lysobacteraceae bacterium]